MPEKPNLERILKEKFDIDSRHWKECLTEHQKTAVSLVRLLTAKGIINEDRLLHALSEQLGIPYLRIQDEDIDSELVKRIPSKFVTHYNFMPLKVIDGALQIAVNDPLELDRVDELKLFLHQEIKTVIAYQKNMLESIKKFYGVGADTLEAIEPENPKDIEVFNAGKNTDIKDESIDPSVIKFLNQVLLDAIKQRATDIHFEPYEGELCIRYRIDGILYEISCPATIKNFQSSIASRIKVMGNLDIAEKRRPQDGRIDVKLDGQSYDMRVSIMPTPHGESIGIRILQRSNPVIGLEALGMTSNNLTTLQAMIKKPHGIILVTGPTGSGKTTTLYSCLNTVNSSERKILTIEDPIEYQLRGITQMQVDTKIGFTFASALRSMLRHDPDVMMVGEIRDMETAELAVRTALTGHLVFSTLHTNDAAGGIARLLDMSIDPFLVSSSVNLIIAQRLVRVICPHCIEHTTPEAEFIHQFNEYHPTGTSFSQGKGCELCRFTGYKGRTGIFEMLVITDVIRDLLLKKTPSHKIKEAAVSSGMKLLKESGWDKITAGITTAQEVIRVTQEEI